MKKLIVKLLIFFFLALIFIIIGVDVSWADQIADYKVDEVLNFDQPKPNKPKDPTFVEKALKFVWDNKYYILGGIVIGFVGYIVYTNVTPSTPETPQSSSNNNTDIASLKAQDPRVIVRPDINLPNSVLVQTHPETVKYYIKENTFNFSELKDSRYGINLNALDNFPMKINADITQDFNENLIVSYFHEDTKNFGLIKSLKTRNGLAFNVLYTEPMLSIYTNDNNILTVRNDALTPAFWIHQSGLSAGASGETCFYAEVKLIQEGTFNIMPYHQVAVVKVSLVDAVPAVTLKSAVFMRDPIEHTDTVHISTNIPAPTVIVEEINENITDNINNIDIPTDVD